MYKLKLDLNQLRVESFDTNTPEGVGIGTVKAHSHHCVSPFETCEDLSCRYTCATCDPTCATCVSCEACYESNNSCYVTCNASCYYGTCATCLTNCQQESCVYICP